MKFKNPYRIQERSTIGGKVEKQAVGMRWNNATKANSPSESTDGL
jgi:hypothetical protein